MRTLRLKILKLIIITVYREESLRVITILNRRLFSENLLNRETFRTYKPAMFI